MSKLLKNTKESSDLGSVRLLNDFDNHEIVIALSDKASGLRAYVAVHSTRLGIAHGGTRMQVYKDESAALRDVLKLSKAMSYKSALAGLPYGGAKGVIVLTNEGFDRDKLLEAYAKKIEKLNGLFHTGTDVGLNDDDIKKMSQYTQFMLGITNKNNQGLSTSKAAALGVYNSIKTATKFKYGSDDLAGKVIAIKGLGKLGGELAIMLHNDKADLIVADVDNSKTKAFTDYAKNTKVVSPKEIHVQKSHIYAPCALGDEFTVKSVGELNCDMVVGGANNQLVDSAAGDAMHAKNILYAPDYVVNAGGLIFVSDELEADGSNPERVFERLEALKDTLLMIFERSANENIPTHRLADIIAQERINSGTA